MPKAKKKKNKSGVGWPGDPLAPTAAAAMPPTPRPSPTVNDDWPIKPKKHKTKRLELNGPVTSPEGDSVKKKSKKLEDGSLTKPSSIFVFKDATAAASPEAAKDASPGTSPADGGVKKKKSKKLEDGSKSTPHSSSIAAAAASPEAAKDTGPGTSPADGRLKKKKSKKLADWSKSTPHSSSIAAADAAPSEAANDAPRSLSPATSSSGISKVDQPRAEEAEEKEAVSPPTPVAGATASSPKNVKARKKKEGPASTLASTSPSFPKKERRMHDPVGKKTASKTADTAAVALADSTLASPQPLASPPATTDRAPAVAKKSDTRKKKKKKKKIKLAPATASSAPVAAPDAENGVAASGDRNPKKRERSPSSAPNLSSGAVESVSAGVSADVNTSAKQQRKKQKVKKGQTALTPNTTDVTTVISSSPWAQATALAHRAASAPVTPSEETIPVVSGDRNPEKQAGSPSPAPNLSSGADVSISAEVSTSAKQQRKKQNVKKDQTALTPKTTTLSAVASTSLASTSQSGAQPTAPVHRAAAAPEMPSKETPPVVSVPTASSGGQGCKPGEGGNGSGGGSDSKVKSPRKIAPAQQDRPGATCSICNSGDTPLNFCAVCDKGFHPQCSDPPRTRRAREGWVCGGCMTLEAAKASIEV